MWMTTIPSIIVTFRCIIYILTFPITNPIFVLAFYLMLKTFPNIKVTFSLIIDQVTPPIEVQALLASIQTITTIISTSCFVIVNIAVSIMHRWLITSGFLRFAKAIMTVITIDMKSTTVTTIIVTNVSVHEIITNPISNPLLNGATLSDTIQPIMGTLRCIIDFITDTIAH